MLIQAYIQMILAHVFAEMPMIEKSAVGSDDLMYLTDLAETGQNGEGNSTVTLKINKYIKIMILVVKIIVLCYLVCLQV